MQRKAQRRKYHYIYKTTCLVNGKYYIGMHSTDNLDDGYLGSGTRLQYSIRKHGKKNFKFEILEHYFTRQDLAAREKELVNEECLNDEMCMNLRFGGEGGFTSEQVHRMWESEQFRANHSFGMKSKWKESLYRDNLSKRNSITMKKHHDKGKIKYDTFSGKKHTPETIAKMKESHQGLQNGNKNSQFGTCWVYNDTESKKIQLIDLPSHLKNNWVKGRKMNLKKIKL